MDITSNITSILLALGALAAMAWLAVAAYRGELP
jgi:hypothetical protein